MDVIRDWDDFELLKSEWDAVYASDPEAQYFLSWEWMADWLKLHQTTWIVLAARDEQEGSSHVGFLPLRNWMQFDEQRGFFNQFILAGAEYSDYTGLLATPEHEAEVIAAFGKHITDVIFWGEFSWHNLLISDRRKQLLLPALSDRRIAQKPITYQIDGIDHGICPFLPLPSDWDRYLETLSANNRQKIRRLLRKVEASDTHRIAFSTGEDQLRDLETMLALWRVKWAPFKGDNTDDIIARNRAMLGGCAERGALLLPVFWDSDRFVAALAIVVDQVKRSLLFVITGRDETYAEVPAGYLLHAYMIRYAIAEGFSEYDFLRGDESYKFLFTDDARRLSAFELKSKTGRNLGEAIHPSWVGEMLEMTLRFENARETAKAEKAYRQILEVDPDNALALYRFGRFEARNDRHSQARQLLERSVAIEPEGDNAWLALAQSLQWLGEVQPAILACRRAIAAAPDNKQARALLVQLTATAKPAPLILGAQRAGILEQAGASAPRADVAAILRHPRPAGKPPGAT
ncbi:MAG: GNAT family N-acetyltransferase [Mycobacteriales bacterium]